MVDVLGAAVPEFSGMLLREGLLGSFALQAPPLTLICASAGYGKTVLASQLARCVAFDAVSWVQIPDVDVSGDLVLRQVADALDRTGRDTDDPISRVVCSPESSALADTIRIRDALEGLSGSRVLLIVDGANALSRLNCLVELATSLNQSTSAESRLVVSCRRIEQEGQVDPSLVWLIEEADLAFSMSEMRTLVTSARIPDSESEARRLHESCSGHPAITRILLRHGDVVCGAHSRDLAWQTERIVSRFDDAAIAALYLAAVLGEGGLAALQASALACDLRADWIGLSRSIPLFYTFDATAGVRSFRVHAVLCDVLKVLSLSQMCEEERRSIRAVAFERLSRDCDYARLASALELHGTEDEIAEWCEHDGFSMMRHTDHSMVTRLICKILPLRLASSPRLLLLRAYVNRGAGAISTAIESAMMARRVAEVEGDQENLVAAALFVARLQFDRGLIAESQRMLEEIESQYGAVASVAAQCLTQAYLAVCDGQAGRLRAASRRVQRLTQAARHLDQGSDEAVFVANCIGAVACHGVGDWASVAAVLAPIARRTDVAPLQQVHVRSNYAVALFELGDLREAIHRAEHVVARCTDMGIEGMLSCAAAALSDMYHALGDDSLARDLDVLATQTFEHTSDQFGLAVHGINSARALRAMGQVEESLSCALSAQLFLASYGPSAHMLHLMASIEVAASQLAFGDSVSAFETVEQVLADPVTAEATGHRLRCDLVLAEIDRARGEWRVAVQRLERYRDYISGGSANMTLACYVRAFPGLMGVLDVALGDAGVPFRVMRLLPGAVIADALACVEDGLGSEQVSIIRKRHALTMAGGKDGCSGPVEGVPTPPYLKVRAFGKLEIESSFGCVEHKHWRKRKARMLFLMLLCAPTHEIPRDIILERLWPEMDRATAQRNFYVNWSHMRKALACCHPDAELQVFADGNSDACWLTGILESDIDAFERELGVLRSARVAQDSAAVVDSAMRLSEIYRGELLPVDLYEEWFEEDRTRTKRDFCDAMVTGARCAVEAGRHDVAIVFLKRASAIDPWREDVYQLTMLCQMEAGQRSSAIETYNRCRARLVDDLGIDPSAETVRIFQDVLAMEDSACFESSYTR